MTSPLPTASFAVSPVCGRRWDHLELLERIDSSHAISASASAMASHIILAVPA